MASNTGIVPPQRRSPLTLRNWHDPGRAPADSQPDRDSFLDCGWGRLLFAHTFASPAALAAELGNEALDKRDIAFYLRDPHVVVSLAPHTLFWIRPTLTGSGSISTVPPRRRTGNSRSVKSVPGAKAISSMRSTRRAAWCPPARNSGTA